MLFRSTCRAFASRRCALTGRCRATVAELWVVRRFYPLFMNESRPPFLFRELVVSLCGVRFGAGCSLSVSANASCSRQRKEASQALSSRRGEPFAKVWTHPASLTTQAFGGATRVLKSASAVCSGPVVLSTPTPNQSLQRTGGHGTQSAKGTAAASPRTAQPPRHARPSLSLGSLGVATRIL